MEITLVQKFLDNLDQIEQLMDEEEFDLMTETIQLNHTVLEGLQNIKDELPEQDWPELMSIKQQLIKRQGEVMAKLETITVKKRPQLQEMSQKVQASQVYNKMKRGY